MDELLISLALVLFIGFSITYILEIDYYFTSLNSQAANVILSNTIYTPIIGLFSGLVSTSIVLLFVLWLKRKAPRPLKEKVPDF